MPAIGTILPQAFCSWYDQPLGVCLTPRECAVAWHVIFEIVPKSRSLGGQPGLSCERTSAVCARVSPKLYGCVTIRSGPPLLLWVVITAWMLVGPRAVMPWPFRMVHRWSPWRFGRPESHARRDEPHVGLDGLTGRGGLQVAITLGGEPTDGAPSS